MRYLIIIIASLLLSNNHYSQVDRPKLIVGIVVDQMKAEYITRYMDNYSENGFKRMINQGYSCKNTHFNYIPTYTGPGHASIYTGTTPSMHGIIANDFYDRFLDEVVYCASDPTVSQTEGDSKAGKMSPTRILCTTIGDEVKMFDEQSKVIGIALKDRASIFPAGHAADAAYWLKGKKFISSTAYLDKMPTWLNEFNNKGLVKKYLSHDWELLLDKNVYISKIDDSPFEKVFEGEKAAVFPHNLPKIYKAIDKYSLIKSTPFGNSITVDLAIAAIDGEQLGQDDTMDMLNISFSSTDYIGHAYGTRAMETEDAYYRLDKDLARLFAHLDKSVGEGNYTVFLTADHGAATPPAYLKNHNIPSGFTDYESIEHKLDSALDSRYTAGDWILNLRSNYIFLNQKLIESKSIDKLNFYRYVKDFLLLQPGVYKAYDRISLMENDYKDWLGSKVKNGFNDKYSPDIIFLLNPGYIGSTYEDYGTTHGSGYIYDTHVPLFWMGYKIPKGKSSELISITDIVPTLCTMFDIPLPSGCTGEPIDFK